MLNYKIHRCSGNRRPDFGWSGEDSIKLHVVAAAGKLDQGAVPS
jgi:hypothetical protein